METLTHLEARRRLQAAADGRLELTEQSALDAHLLDCAECRAYAAELAAVEAGLRRVLAQRWDHAPGPRPGLARRLADPGGKPMQSQRPFDLIGRMAGGVAALLLVAALIFTLQVQANRPAAGSTDDVTPTTDMAATESAGTTQTAAAFVPTLPPQPTRHFDPLSYQQPVGAEFPGLGALTGYSLWSLSLTDVNVLMIWHSPAVPASEYAFSLHLEDASGSLAAQADSSPLSFRSTREWLAGEYSEVLVALTFPADLPPGDYTLYAAVTDTQDGARVAPTSGDLTADGRVRLGTLTLLLSATATPTPADYVAAPCANAACTPTPVYCLGHCPYAMELQPTQPPCLAGEACPTPPAPAFTPAPLVYVVEVGDTCISVAEMFDLTPTQLITQNGLDDNCNLSVGQSLLVAYPTATPPPFDGTPLPPMPSATPCPAACAPTPTPTAATDRIP